MAKGGWSPVGWEMVSEGLRSTSPRGASSLFQSMRQIVLWSLVTDRSVFRGKVLHDDLRDDQRTSVLLWVQGFSVRETRVTICVERGFETDAGCF